MKRQYLHLTLLTSLTSSYRLIIFTLPYLQSLHFLTFTLTYYSYLNNFTCTLEFTAFPPPRLSLKQKVTLPFLPAVGAFYPVIHPLCSLHEDPQRTHTYKQTRHLVHTRPCMYKEIKKEGNKHSEHEI